MMRLKPIRADNLSNSHGFFTREGGVSAGIYEGLNCGQGSDDDKELVTENRKRVAKMFDLYTKDLVSVHQVHSNLVAHVTEPLEGEKPRCDAMVTDRPGVALGILTADCAPIFFEDRARGVVGAAHSGWRGAVGGVISATIEAMESLGADRSQIAASVGPCISQAAYEVGPEFFDQFLIEDQAFAQYFAQGEGERMMFDLPRFALDRLRAAGVEDVCWTGHCTYSDPKRFFSYRRSCHQGEPDYGRLISVISL